MPSFSTPLHRTQEDLPSWHFVDDGDGGADEKMFAVFMHLKAQGWRGQVASDPTGPYLEMNADNPTRQVQARTGDRLVVDFDGPKLITTEQAEEFFTEGA